MGADAVSYNETYSFLAGSSIVTITNYCTRFSRRISNISIADKVSVCIIITLFCLFCVLQNMKIMLFSFKTFFFAYSTLWILGCSTVLSRRDTILFDYFT